MKKNSFCYHHDKCVLCLMNRTNICIMSTSFILYIIFLGTAASFEIDFDFQNKIEKGKDRYSELLQKAVTYGDCWKTAMQELHVGCKKITEDVQSRLALAFTNCFLAHTGMENPCLCDFNIPIASCLKNSTDRVFYTYTEFYTHTQSICHYLQYREWQEEAARTVLMLTESSLEVVERLNDLSKSQAEMQDLQRLAISDHKKLLLYSKLLSNQLLQSRSNARNVYNEFKIATNQQKHLLFEVFDRVKNLQNFVLGELSGLYTITYYIVASILIYIITSTRRTADARIWLILVISLCVVVERFVIFYSIEDINLNPLETNTLVYSRIWSCRKMSFVICLVILIVYYYKYIDYNIINNELLKEIRMQNQELQMFIKGMSSCESLLGSAKSSQITPLKTTETVSKTDIFKNKEKLSEDINPVNHTSKSKTISKKIANKENILTPVNIENKRNSIQTAKILTEVPSSASPPYNLRRSSRLNSPISPCFKLKLTHL